MELESGYLTQQLNAIISVALLKKITWIFKQNTWKGYYVIL